MHGLDQSTDLKFMEGQKLTQLALGCFEFQLMFSPGTRIAVQSMFSINKDGVDAGTFACKPSQAKELYVLLGKNIEKIAIETDGQIELHFEDGYLLTIFDSNTLQESYVIWHSKDFYAV